MPWFDRYIAGYAEEVYRKLDEAFLYGEGFIPHLPEPAPNTFRSNPEPRLGYIDARRTDGCVALITSI